MCKVNNHFEARTIQLTEELQKIQTKLQIAENALKQKDKYIQMLINKKIIVLVIIIKKNKRKMLKSMKILKIRNI